MFSRPPWVDGAAFAGVNRYRSPPWSADAAVMVIWLPSCTADLVFAVSRKTSSVIGRSGRNTTVSWPATVWWFGAIVNCNVIFGRCGSGLAYVVHELGTKVGDGAEGPL